MKLKFFHDSGHGWLQVPKSIKLASRYASPYSYQDRDFFYLEEDLDCPKFIEAWHDQNPLEKIEIESIYDGDVSPIRSL